MCAHQVVPISRLRRRILEAVNRCLASLEVADPSAVLLSCPQLLLRDRAVERMS